MSSAPSTPTRIKRTLAFSPSSPDFLKIVYGDNVFDRKSVCLHTPSLGDIDNDDFSSVIFNYKQVMTKEQVLIIYGLKNVCVLYNDDGTFRSTFLDTRAFESWHTHGNIKTYYAHPLGFKTSVVPEIELKDLGIALYSVPELPSVPIGVADASII